MISLHSPVNSTIDPPPDLSPATEIRPIETSDILRGYFDRQELARQLGVTLHTLKRWDAVGCAPPFIRLGGRRLYSIETVRTWLAEQHGVHARRAGAAKAARG